MPPTPRTAIVPNPSAVPSVGRVRRRVDSGHQSMAKKLTFLIILLFAGFLSSVIVGGAACLWSPRASTTEHIRGSLAEAHLLPLWEDMGWSLPSSGSHDTIICEITKGFGFRHSADGQSPDAP